MLPVTDRNKRIYFGDYKLNDENALQAVRCAVGDAEATRPPADLSGRGIVIPGGGDKYLPSVWINVRMLRHHGCDLPIQVWHLGPDEMPDRVRRRLAEHGVECVDARRLRDERWPHKRLGGWELKAYAMLHCPFAEVMLLDADNMAVRDPSFLFDDPAYKEHGSLFWPDRGRWKPDNPIWGLTGIPYRDEPEIESGQMLIDKTRCWRQLLLANWFNEQSEYWYKLMHGDKDTFRLAWRSMRQHATGQRRDPMPEYAMAAQRTVNRHGYFEQPAPDGQLLFQHGIKWRMGAVQQPTGYQLAGECLGFLREIYPADDDREWYLIVGSAAYVPEWWAQHGDYFRERFRVVALNNAWAVTRGRTDGWYISNDFFSTGKMLPTHDELRRELRCVRMGINSYWLKSPHWYESPCNGTMALNAAYDILNRCHARKVRAGIVFIGCDMIYRNDGTDHWYGAGKADPLRAGEAWLNRALAELKAIGTAAGGIYNASEVESRLPFERYTDHLGGGE